MRTVTAAMVLGGALLCTAACKQSAESAAPAGSASAAATPSAAPSAAAAAPAIQVDPEVAKMVKAVVANCKIEESGASVNDCKNKEMDALPAYAKEKKTDSYYASLAEIAMTDGQKDKNTFAAIVAIVNNTGWAGGYDWLKKNATFPGAADRFVEFDSKVTDDQAFSFGSMGAAIPLLGGKKDKLMALIDQRKPGGQLRTSLVGSLLDWGGVALLPDLDAFIKKTTNSDDKYAATWSVGIATYVDPLGGGGSPPPSDADKTKMCDWAKGFVKDPDPKAAHGAIASMGRCKGAYIDAGLDAIEAQIKPGSFGETLEDELKDMCWSEGFIGFPSNGTPQQCDRAMGIVDKVSKDATLPPNDRRNVVFDADVIGKVSPPATQAKAKAIIAKFVNDKDKSVADTAKGYQKDFK